MQPRENSCHLHHQFAQTASRCENQTVQKHVKKLTANGCENNKAAKLTLKRASLIDSSYQTIQMFNCILNTPKPGLSNPHASINTLQKYCFSFIRRFDI